MDCVHNDVQELPSTALTLFPTPTLKSHLLRARGDVKAIKEAKDTYSLPVCVADEFYKGKL